MEMTKPGPEVSVIIPCFNDGVFLKQALKSVFAQTLPPGQILVVNDGSTDSKTIALLDRLDEPAVRVIHQENRGLGGARNTGLRHATGKYVYFLDADNTLLRECLMILSSMLEADEGAIAAYSKMWLRGGPRSGTEWGEAYNPYFLLAHNQWDAGMMLRREAVHKHDLYYDDTKRCHGYEDWELNIRLTKTGKPILFCSKPLYIYRVRKESLLAASRRQFPEIVNYIQQKHRDLYTPERLLKLKRSHAPSLAIDCKVGDCAGVRRFLTCQSFQDWIIETEFKSTQKQNVRYRLIHAGPEALHRLPPEALECALIAMECSWKIEHCVLAVKDTRASYREDPTRSQLDYYPVAIIGRTTEEIDEGKIFEILTRCEKVIVFPERSTGTQAGWSPTLLRRSDILLPSHDGVVDLRKKLSSWGKTILGPDLHGRCVQLYDSFYYRVLSSETNWMLRKNTRKYLGKTAERLLSRTIYGAFLAKPPTSNLNGAASTLGGVSPLFINSKQSQKIHILIATSWLNEGGVEQTILDLCRLLDPSRFKITIATTLPSRQTWDHLARLTGTSVYHLADFLNPTAIPNGLIHLVLNQPADCIYIIHSRAAYESLKLFKRIAPWLTIIDRNEVLDPGGGFPVLSAQAGNNVIDVRTVGHAKLADHMAAEYRLTRDTLRVIYAGTDMGRIQNSLSLRRGQLHEICQTSPDAPIVTFVGRFTAQKRPDVFVRTVVKCLELKPACNAHFAMIGDGESRPAVEQLVAKAGLNKRIHLLGARANAIDLLADSTLLMMPSAYEGLALVSYEAMALGVPQIFADIGGQSELITPETGILITNGPGEEVRYAEACLQLLSDTDRQARMASAGKKRIKAHFTAESTAKQYANTFEELAELSRKRASEIPHLKPPHINPLHELA
jgi:glycosyltransferase involved in cell wall biosynthesis